MSELSNQHRQRFSNALERLGGDEETFVMLAEMVAEDAPAMLSKLNLEVESANLAEAARNGHSLKGLLSTFETGSPVSELQPLIEAARANEVTEAKRLMEKLESSLYQLIEEVRGLAVNEHS